MKPIVDTEGLHSPAYTESHLRELYHPRIGQTGRIVGFLIDQINEYEAALERLVVVAEEASLHMTSYPSPRPTLASRTLDSIAHARRVLGEVGK